MDEPLTAGAAGATATRLVTFGPNGASFSDPYSGIDYPPALFPAQGTIEFVLRYVGPNGDVLDTRGADFRLPGDSVIDITDQGGLYFTIDPTGGHIPGPTHLPVVQTSTIVRDGIFRCIAVSYGSAGLMIYVNGVLEDSDPSVTASLIRSTISLGDFADEYNAGSSFLGDIFYVRTSDTQADVVLPETIGCDGPPLTPPISCNGDCDGSGEVSVDEILTLVNIDLGSADASACPNGIPSGRDADITLIIQAVGYALASCPAS